MLDTDSGAGVVAAGDIVRSRNFVIIEGAKIGPENQVEEIKLCKSTFIRTCVVSVSQSTGKM